MEQLLLSGKDGWVVSPGGGVWGRKAMDCWDASDGSAHCPTPPAFVTAAQHQTRSRQPMLYSGH